MCMYDDLNLAEQPRVTGTVVRGYIMRYNPTESWTEDLVALPPGTVAQDADAVSHYRKGEDGRFYEYVGWAPSTEDNPIYVLAAEHLPPVPTVLTREGELEGIPVYQRTGETEVLCPVCGGQTESVQLRGLQAFRCYDQDEPDCALGFFIRANAQ